MSNELQTKLDAILADKNTNLLPNHLKVGVTCLGVEGVFEGDTLDYNVVINDGDDSTSIREKIKTAYSGCGFVKITIKRTDDWVNWTAIEMSEIGVKSSDGYVSISNPIEVYLGHGTNATLPSDGLFCGTSQMGYTVTNFVVKNNSSQADAGKVFGAFSQSKDIRYTISDNYGTVDQNIQIGMDCKIKLSNANTTLINASDYDFTQQYNKLSLIYMIYKAPTINSGKVLTLPASMYSACTAEEWQVLTNKGWTIQQN